MSSSIGEMSLADVIQANAVGENTCRVLVTTPLGRGTVFVAGGAVVDAVYGDLVGEEAFCALLNASDVRFVVKTGATAERHRIRSSWQALMLNAMTLRFENKLPVPRFAKSGADSKADTVPIAAESVSIAQVVANAVPAPPAPAPSRPLPGPPASSGMTSAVRVVSPRPAAESAPRRARAFLAGGVVVLCAAAALWLVMRPGAPPKTLGAPPAEPASPLAPVEVTELTAAGDELPAFVAGVAPRSPDPESAVLPTIICRVLIDERGVVREARVFRSRLDLASFEDAALAAVKTYSFKPGRRAGRPVAVWLNWPVEFK